MVVVDGSRQERVPQEEGKEQLPEVSKISVKISESEDEAEVADEEHEMVVSITKIKKLKTEVRRNVNDLIDCVMGQLNNNT